jgi:hypothetical protein
MLQAFFIWMLHMFHTYVARVCLKCFCCLSYVAISVFMLQVASGLSGCCICFTHMLQLYVLNVSSASDLCCIQVFRVSNVCLESHGDTAWALGEVAW